MRSRRASTIFIFVLLILLIFQSSPATSQELEDEMDFDYDENSEFGPEHWGDLKPEWSECRDGKNQSPIDLNYENIIPMASLWSLITSYWPSAATLKNRGHDIMVGWNEGGGPIFIHGRRFELQQCHWHSPSEHTVDGKRYPLEMHMVHSSSEGKTAVVGIMYKYGQEDPFISKLMGALGYLVDTQQSEVHLGPIKPPKIEMGTSYYRYSGSLTTPPCSEGVVWSLIKRVKTVSKEQLDLLRTAVHNKSNARPIQPINERKVLLYQQWIDAEIATS